MIELKLDRDQTKKFWDETYAAVDGEMLLLDEYLYDKYTIVKRVWNSRMTLTLTIEDEMYASWLRLNL